MQINNTFKILIIFLLLLFFTNCKNENKDKAKYVKTDNKSETKVETKKVTTEEKPFLEINGKPFYQKDILNFANFMLSEIDVNTLNNPKINKKIMDDFIKNQVLKQEAEKNHIKIDKSKLENILKNFNSKMEKDNKSMTVFHSVVNSKHFRENLETQIMIQKLIETKLTDEIQISENELKEYYKKFIANYPRKKLYHVYHIVTSDKASAYEARKMLKKRNAFVKVAKKYSIGPEKDKGGDLGYIDLTEFPDVFKNLKKLKKRKISNVIKSDYGYHIFQLRDVKLLKKPKFEEISGRLYADLYSQKQDKMINDYIKELVNNAKIRIYNNSFIINPTREQLNDNK